MWGACQKPGTIGLSPGGGSVAVGGGNSEDDANVAGGAAGAGGSLVVNVNLNVAPDAANADTALSSAPTLDANCGMLTSKTVRQPVDVLLVLDRSASMTYSIAQDCNCSGTTPTSANACRNSGSCTDRWTAIRSAVATTLVGAGAVQWGLEFFASSLSCTLTGTPEVPISADSADAIEAQIAATTPGSNTPTRAAITAATGYLQALGDNHKKYILLATDGVPNCGSGMDQSVSDIDGATAAVSAAAAAGFPVYVVGIGPSVSNLTQLAKAGGTNDYYPAISPDQLTQALLSISSFFGSCSYRSNQVPPDPDNIAVYVNKQRVDQNDSNGWKFGATTQEFELTGSYCQQVLSGNDVTVEILYGCLGLPSFPQVIP
jgi:hypothetical protein